MFEKFLSINAGDFQQRYEGTYGFFRNKDRKRILVQIASVRDGRCNFTDAAGAAYHLEADSLEDQGFEFVPPKAQWYNSPDATYLVRRAAARQFSRGINERNTTIQRISPNGMLQVCNVNFPTLEAIYLKSFPPQEAYAKWKERAAVAISGQLAIGTASEKLYLLDKGIGTYRRTDNHFMFKLEEPDLWRTEVSDAIKALGCTVEVA
jgi:hypothetical protein